MEGTGNARAESPSSPPPRSLPGSDVPRPCDARKRRCCRGRADWRAAGPRHPGGTDRRAPHDIQIQSEHAGHPAIDRVRRRLHRLTSTLNEPQCIGELQSAGKTNRCVLAQTQSGGRFDRRHPIRFDFPQDLGRSDSHHEQRRLAELGSMEPFFGTLKTELRRDRSPEFRTPDQKIAWPSGRCRTTSDPCRLICAPCPGKRILTEFIVEACTKWCQTPDRDVPLVLVVLDDGPPLVIAAFGANRMGWNRGAALRAVADLALLDMVVSASTASSGVGVFSFWDSHRCEDPD